MSPAITSNVLYLSSFRKQQPSSHDHRNQAADVVDLGIPETAEQRMRRHAAAIRQRLDAQRAASVQLAEQRSPTTEQPGRKE